MNVIKKLTVLSLVGGLIISCDKNDEVTQDSVASYERSSNFNVNFQYASTIQVGGETASEISAFDSKTNKLFVVNVESTEISVFDISDIHNPVQMPSISISTGAPNSVAVSKGLLAVAVENENKQEPGSILVYDTEDQTMQASYTVGALPDMVTFSPNGELIVSANEGEPDNDYVVDPVGSVSIITVETGEISTLTFEAFDSQQAMLESQGFRVFGPNATLAQDVEPEYVAISQNNETAWVSLQENNGMAKINLVTKTIEAIYPLGLKDYNLPENAIDPSDDDNVKELNTWPVYGMYQPDAIEYVKINGMDLIFSANEGDSRDYDGYSEEERCDDLVLDPTVFPNADFLQQDENLGRIKVTTANGDYDNDGDYDAIYNYGARSFSVWSADGQLLYDSGNDISEITLDLTPDRFNDDDGRSDDKGAEPEAVEILKIQGNKYVLFVGLERNDQVLVFDISNPFAPEFIQILSHDGDEAPEGVLAIPAKDSPTGNDLLVVSNEDSGTVTFYENIQ